MLHSKDDLVVIDEFSTGQPGFNEQYEELQKNLVFTPSNTILWYMCPICSRKSATEDRLNKHIEQKHSTDPHDVTNRDLGPMVRHGSEPFKCHVCPFACTTNADLMRHSKKHKGVKPYGCNICGKTFSQKGNLKPHMLRHSGESPYQCQICSKSFNHKTSFKKHLDDHSNPKKFSCRFCDKFTFNTAEQRNKHEQTKHTKADVDCIICGVILNSRLGLKMHIAQMHPEYPGATDHSAEKKWACQYCDKKFSTKAYLIVHHKIHRGEKPFKCADCDYRAVSRDSIKKHAERSHGQMKLLSCNLCDKQFTYYSHKKAHMLRHYNLKPFSCKECKRSFLLKRHLTDHMRMHRGEPTFRCDKCDVAYVLPDSLRKHKDLHLSAPLSCHICNQEFWVMGRYNKHMMMHKREYNGKDVTVRKPFKCHLCTKAFKVKRFLTKHLLNGCNDGEEGNLTCTECGDELPSDRLLKKHMKIFHNLKEYSCFVCAEAFKRIQHLMDHVEKFHPNEADKDVRGLHMSMQKDKVDRCKSTYKIEMLTGSERIRANNQITLVPEEEGDVAVLVINEHTMDPASIKTEPSEVTYECFTCSELFVSYDELVVHQATHETDLQVPGNADMHGAIVKEESSAPTYHLDTIELDLQNMEEMANKQVKMDEDEVAIASGEEEEEVEDAGESTTCYECSVCHARYATRSECNDHYISAHLTIIQAKPKATKRYV